MSKTIEEQVEEFSIEGWDIMLNAEGPTAGQYRVQAMGLYNAIKPKLLKALQERDRIAREAERERIWQEVFNKPASPEEESDEGDIWIAEMYEKRFRKLLPKPNITSDK